MAPVLKPGDIVFAKKIHHMHIYANSIVIANINGKEIIKRVGLVKNGKVFLIGDNKAASTDSRTFGLVPCNVVLGKVVFWVPNIVARFNSRLMKH
ncbi:S26 family signal peptidase [Candidatus Saccharibacteria bacterium]|nr:S26 family signal peptidase [Candidatus Saccharibacteria bacterium]